MKGVALWALVFLTVSDDRSSLKATSVSSLLCFPFGFPFKWGRETTKVCARSGSRAHRADRARKRVRRTGSKVHAG